MRQVLQWRPPLWLVAVIVGSTLALSYGGGYVQGAQTTAQGGVCTESAEVCAQFDNFWKVWNIAEARFLDPAAIEPDAMIAGAINGMLNTLNDRGHTRYDTAEQFEREQESQRGSYEGIGAYINDESGLPVVVAPIEGSPAEAAGVQAGDIIVKVDGERTDGQTVDEVVRRVRGAPGTTVTLELMRQGNEAPIVLEIERAAINVPAVTWRMLPGNVAHIKLSQFSEKATSEMEAALKAAQEAGAQKYVLDLRNNPGGLLNQAISVTSQFLPQDEIVLRIRGRDGKEEVYRANAGNPDTDTPVVVLINAGSASSSEIFAGALQDHKRATIIGVQTIGLGTVITPVQLEDGSAVYIGTAEWLTPDGNELRHEGVTPDIEVALTGEARPLTPSAARDLSDQEIIESDDAQLLRALEVLGVNTSSEGPSAFMAR